MKRFFRRVVSALLILMITLSSSTLGVLAAESNKTNGEKTNINYEKGSIEELFKTTSNITNNVIMFAESSGNTSRELIYTYEQDDINYKVYDQASVDLSSSHSFVYKIDANNTETLVREEIVNVEDSVITTIIIENGEKTVDVLDLNKESIPTLGTVYETTGNLSVCGTWNGYPVSDTYEYWGSFKHSYSITGTTVAAVSVTINAIVKVASNISPVTKITVTAISSLVSYIVNKNVKRTYVDEHVSYRWTEIPNVVLQQRAVERTIRTFYLDSNYATVIDTVTTYAYSQYYEE